LFVGLNGVAVRAIGCDSTSVWQRFVIGRPPAALGEAPLIGNLATVRIDAQRGAVGVAVRMGVGIEPTRIDD